MIGIGRADGAHSPVAHRLSRLAALADADFTALEAAEKEARSVPRWRDILLEWTPMGEPQVVVSGWAARVRTLADGRRQFLSFFLPGDLIGYGGQPRPVAAATVTALTDVTLATAPDPQYHPMLREAYEVGRAIDKAHLLAQIARLGRMNAQERLTDLILEVFERLELAGLVEAGEFELPMTQESLADALGLTPVHVNRTVQALRRDGDVVWKSSRLTLPDPAALRAKIGRLPVVVMANA